MKIFDIIDEYGPKVVEQSKKIKNTVIEHLSEIHAEALKKNEERANNKYIKSQPFPKQNNNPAIWDIVIEEMKRRDEEGLIKYGTRLQGFNGRDSLWDAYEEALDLVVYLRQTIYERKVDAESKVP